MPITRTVLVSFALIKLIYNYGYHHTSTYRNTDALLEINLYQYYNVPPEWHDLKFHLREVVSKITNHEYLL